MTLPYLPGGVGPNAVAGLAEVLARRLRGAGSAEPLLTASGKAEFEESRGRITGSLDGVDVVIRTSGSTDGRGRLVGLSLDALVASARATLDRLGGPGVWLTSLPVHGVAGFQVVLRSVLAGRRPVVFAPGRGFDAELFRGCVADLAAGTPAGTPRYLSLVPTQLGRALEQAPEALATFDAVLVGGAALAPDLRARAVDAGVRVVRTYGMTETSGGCVYDGVPLDGASVRVVDGRVQLAGPMLATRYLDDGPQPFVRDADLATGRGGEASGRSPSGAGTGGSESGGTGSDGLAGVGRRWLVTPDAGTWDGNRLSVLGRVDDVIISGGVNVHPAAVEAALSALGGTWIVVGVPDAEWGQRLVAVTDLASPPTVDAVRATTGHLAPAERPKEVRSIGTWPVRPTGKIDRREVRAWAEASGRR